MLPEPSGTSRKSPRRIRATLASGDFRVTGDYSRSELAALEANGWIVVWREPTP